jgi:hypothetical protein
MAYTTFVELHIFILSRCFCVIFAVVSERRSENVFCSLKANNISTLLGLFSVNLCFIQYQTPVNVAHVHREWVTLVSLLLFQ